MIWVASAKDFLIGAVNVCCEGRGFLLDSLPASVGVAWKGNACDFDSEGVGPIPPLFPGFNRMKPRSAIWSCKEVGS